MYLVKGPVNWRSLHQLTRHTPDLPLWTPLSEFPLKQLTQPKRLISRVFYLPERLSAGAGKAVGSPVLKRAA
ncbi:MAG: hypothetical protein HKN29_07375 [Rhodothermales bacterium]|nr:hypothetical protein [Rhodothermales bacterium]